jgi:3-oxoacyl-[acyl-carrier protein] reductase
MTELVKAFDLTGQTALVTGASRGIGKAIAFELAASGARVLINYRSSREGAESCAEEILKSKSSGEGIPLGFDISDEQATKDALQKAQKEFGAIGVLVNNAGITEDQLLFRVKKESLRRVFETNLESMFTTSQLCARGMMKAGGGSIINMSSVIGQMGNAGQSVYAATKSGVFGFTKSLARELAPKKIRVNAIAPGFIETDMTQALEDEQKEKISAQIPLRRLGSPLDVAQAALFLASPMSSYMTGQVIAVNGGLYM